VSRAMLSAALRARAHVQVLLRKAQALTAQQHAGAQPQHWH
jgi:hypothetical protein